MLSTHESVPKRSYRRIITSSSARLNCAVAWVVLSCLCMLLSEKNANEDADANACGIRAQVAARLVLLEFHDGASDDDHLEAFLLHESLGLVA